MCNIKDRDPDVDTNSQIEWTDSQPVCEHCGGTLASPQQMDQAWENGLDLCRFGWVNDGTAR